jgi:hypothetical protein
VAVCGLQGIDRDAKGLEMMEDPGREGPQIRAPPLDIPGREEAGEGEGGRRGHEALGVQGVTR